ncbi:hypothetical protein K439DRAFT_1292471, partial [Ramaria rubella]
WNKHYCVYMSHGALWREMIDEEFNVRFIATSPSVSTMELMEGVKQSLQYASLEGVSACDCQEGEECLMLSFPLFLPEDNPMQAEECSHAGLMTNKMCHTCMVGSTQAFKRSAEGYLSFFKVGPICALANMHEDIQNQLEHATMPNAWTPIDSLVQNTGMKDQISNTVIEQLVALGYRLQQ